MNTPFRFPEVRVVEASAGSGKTHALAKRYLQLLLLTAPQTSLAFKHILAITFTNKAAWEMKGRIIGQLKRLALNQVSPAEAKELLGPVPLDQAGALCRSLMPEIIRHYHFFQVQTIDSFMNTLLAGCAFKINLSARFRIRRNSADYLALSVDQLIDAAAKDRHLRDLFDAFIRQYLFLENRSGWFPKDDLLGVIGTLYAQHNTYQKPFLTWGKAKKVGEDKRRFMELVRQMAQDLPEGTDQRFAQSLREFVAEHETGFDVDQLSRYFGRPEFPICGGRHSDAMDKLWQKCRHLLHEICWNEAYSSFDSYVWLYEEVNQRMGILQTKDDVLFLEQLNKKAGDLFEEGLVSLGELYYRIAVRLRHYLIDEFQDTSLAQWQNLSSMIEDALSEDGTLFYVGDKKQAIYSFRGGHSMLFDGLKQKYRDLNFSEETLTYNRRSQKNIVEFNNHIFAVAQLRKFIHSLQELDMLRDKDIAFNEEDWQRLENIFGQGRQTVLEGRPHGAVRVEKVLGRKKEDRQELIRQRLLAIVADARTRFALKDILVLTRNNSQVQTVTQWLLHEGLYAQSERTSDIKNHPLVMDLIYFLRWVNSPADNAALARFLLGDLMARATGLTPPQIQQFLFDCRQKRSAGRDIAYYKCLRDAYPDIWKEYFELFLAQAAYYPLYELAVSLCGQWRCLDHFPGAQGFIMHFLELIKRREEHSCGLEPFLEYFEALEDEERFVPMAGQDAIRVLTVHKAKGLEAPVVILPFCEMTIKPGSGDKNGGQSFTWDLEEGGMRLLRLKESYARYCAPLRSRFSREYKEAFFAELNNLYVALTRPVWELHILIPERAGNSINPAQFLVPSDWYQVGEYHRPSASAPEPQRWFLPVTAYRPWLSQLHEESFYRVPGGRAARRQGEILHFCLAQIKNLTGLDAAAVIDSALSAAAARYPQVMSWDEIRKTVFGLVSLPSWKSFFFLPADAQVFCEQELVDADGQLRRVDRMVVLEKEVWVIDYKSSLSPEPQEEQLGLYQELAAAMYPGRMIKTFILSLKYSEAPCEIS